jgi:hypothetical protein
LFNFFQPKLIQWGDGTYSIRKWSIIGQLYLSKHGNWLTEKTKYLFSEVYTKSRAKMIADTTATYSTTLSQRSVFSQYNYDLQWLSSRDNKTRDEHKDADGQIAIDGYFRVGGESMKHPGGGSDAANNINCRCYILPVKRI